MPIVTIKMVEGRTDDQKRALVEEVTAAVSKTINAPKENIWVVIEDMAPNNFATGGVLKSDN